ncbi:MFS transporter [Micromonospora sp. WMMD1274]|uniref:MFS transporter n=1 Tax=Micromonospora sp. WMMD1274 TaxID=3404116 RepID=UPI003B93F477
MYGPAVYGVSAAAVALPDAAEHLDVRGSGLAWLLSAYAAGVGVGAVTAGRLVDLRGSRPVLLTGAASLTVGALVCAVASTLPAVVIGRVLLAVGSGALMVTALAGVAQLAARRQKALAAFGACLAGFSATAPLAGAVAAYGSWRAAIVLPVLSLAAVPLCWSLTAGSRRIDRVDWLAAGLLAAVAAGLLLTVQTAAQQAAWEGTVIAAVATAAAAASLAVRHRSRPFGIPPRGILSAAWFWRAAITGAGVYAGLFAVLYAAPHLLSRQGHSTMSIGALLLPGAVIGAVLARLAARVARRPPAGRLLAGVNVLVAAALCYAAVDPRTLPVAAACTAAFTASAVAQILLTARTTDNAAVHARGGAIGLLTLATFLGGGCGAALCASLWQAWGPTVSLAAVAVLPAAWRRRSPADGTTCA